jgi:hypothetical protein
VPELTLDDVHRHPLASQLDGVGMTELMGRKAPSHTGLGSELRQLASRGRRSPRAPTSWAIDHAQQRPDRQLDPAFKPGA